MEKISANSLTLSSPIYEEGIKRPNEWRWMVASTRTERSYQKVSFVRKESRKGRSEVKSMIKWSNLLHELAFRGKYRTPLNQISYTSAAKTSKILDVQTDFIILNRKNFNSQQLNFAPDRVYENCVKVPAFMNKCIKLLKSKSEIPVEKTFSPTKYRISPEGVVLKKITVNQSNVVNFHLKV